MEKGQRRGKEEKVHGVTKQRRQFVTPSARHRAREKTVMFK